MAAVASVSNMDLDCSCQSHRFGFIGAKRMADQATLDQLRPISSNVDYFDLDDILASNEKVPCKFEMPVYRLGFLDPSSSEEHLAKGTKMELPYWLCRELCTRRRRIVSVEFPKVYCETYRQIYKADPNALDLHKMGPYFYKFGVKLLHLEHYDAGSVAGSISQVCIFHANISLCDSLS